MLAVVSVRGLWDSEPRRRGGESEELDGVVSVFEQVLVFVLLLLVEGAQLAHGIHGRVLQIRGGRMG